MFCKRWKPEELLPTAELLSYLLQLDSRIIGVAVTGSLARLESKIHDIDLVILHGGSIKDGIAQDPERTEPYYNDDLSLASTLSPEISRALSQARKDISVNYIFTNVRAIWECAYLDSLSKKEAVKDFYRRIFCDLPLIVLNPIGRFRKLIDDPVRVKQILLNKNIKSMPHSHELLYSGFLIRHQCENPACRPKQTWEECRQEIRRRKNHWWHPLG